MFTSSGRVIKYAFQNFFRNFWLSFVTLTILFLALASINSLVILDALAKTAVNAVEDKIDVTIYFKPIVKEEQVLNVQSYISTLDGVKDVEYISRDEALVNFRYKHRNNEKIISALDELKDNPLGATLVVHADATDKYQEILKNLEGEQYASMIESKDFEDHRLVIEKITQVTKRVSATMMIIAIIFSLISILIVFNTIRVAIYTHRDEIRMMKLVGATRGFILAPYLVEGILFGLFGTILAFVVIYPLLGILQPYIETFFENGRLDLVKYFNDNFIKIFGIQFAVATIINVLAAWWATRKYLSE